MSVMICRYGKERPIALIPNRCILEVPFSSSQGLVVTVLQKRDLVRRALILYNSSTFGNVFNGLLMFSVGSNMYSGGKVSDNTCKSKSKMCLLGHSDFGSSRCFASG